MDLFTAIKERRSCRDFLPDPINDETIEKILDAASWAPSPLNMQPWQFIVIINQEIKDKIYEEAERCREWALEESARVPYPDVARWQQVRDRAGMLARRSRQLAERWP